MTLPKLPFRLAEIPYAELIFEGEMTEPVYLWAPALPAMPLTIKWVDEDGQEHIHGVAVTRSYLENVKAEHDRYLEALEAKLATRPRSHADMAHRSLYRSSMTCSWLSSDASLSIAWPFA
mgnify:CR=1 FL=1